MNNKRPLSSTLISMLTGILIIFGSAFSAMAADGEVGNLKSTTHTLGTTDEYSQNTVISMNWDTAVQTDCTLVGYNFKFSTSADDTVVETNNYSAAATGTDSASFTGKDGEAYYFHIKAVFTADEAITIDGVDYEAGEDYWGSLVTEGPYYIDDTAPLNPSVSINSGETSTDSINVTLTLGATNASKMNISNSSFGAGTWEDYSTSKAWTLTTGDGTKTIYVQFQDTAENISQTNDNIELAVTSLSVSSGDTTVTKGTTLTFTASGGTPDYTWSVIEEKDEDGTDADTGSVATIAEDPSDNTNGILEPVGAGTCKVQITDNASETADSSVITVTVLSISPNTATVTNGQTQQFTAENGTSPFTWSITSDNNAGTITSTGLFEAHASNTGAETITVTDVNNETATAAVAVSSVSMAVNEGGTQSVTVGTAPTTTLSVIVKEGAAGTANYVVDFSITADPNTGDYVKGSFSESAVTSGNEVTTLQALTDASGIASAPFFAGQKAGTYTISAACTEKDADGVLGGSTTSVSVTNSPRTFTITGTAGDAVNIEYFSGNDQTGTPDTALTNPFVVLVTDAYSNPKLGTTVTFAVGDGETGTLSAETDATDSNGKASTIMTPAAGTNTATATVDGLTGSPVTFTAESGVIKIFSLITTATTNTNTIGFVLEGTGITTAHELGTAVENCDLVSEWIVETQSYLSHPMSVETYNNFSLEIGSVYFVSVTSDHDFTFTGILPGSIVKTLSTTDTTNTNAAGLPYSKAGILNAHELGQDIGNCDLISKWVVETQSYLSHPMSVETYNNFGIECGQGYFISITENTSWSW